jgi:TP901 family phage tail tape measure protein
VAFNVVTLVFKAVDKFSSVAGKVDRDLKKLQRNFKKTDQAAKKTGKGMGKFTAALKKVPGPLKALVAGMVGITAFKAAAKMANDFEDALLDLQAITGASGEDLAFLKQSAFELGTQFAKTGGEVLTGMKLVASAKPELLENAKALKAVTKQALLLSQAAGIDMPTAANATAQALNIFGLEGKEAARIANLLAAESKFGASEIIDTSEALIKAGPAAKIAGMEVESLVAGIEALAKGGIKGPQAGTGLNSTILKLSEAGFDFSKQSLDEVMLKIKDALEKIDDPAQRIAALTKLVGLENVKTAGALLTAAGSMDEYQKKITGTNVAQEQAAIRAKSLRFKIGQLGSIVEEKVVKTFEKMRPMVASVVDKVTEMVAELDPETLEGIAAAFTVIGFALRGVLEVLDLMLMPIELALKFLVKMGKLIGLVGAEIATLGGTDFLAEAGNILFGSGEDEKKKLADEAATIFDAAAKAEVGGEIEITINDKGGNVEKATAKGSGVDLPVGMNMGGAG